MKKLYLSVCLLFCFGCATTVPVSDYAVLAQNTLNRMNAAYADKNLDAFKYYVDVNPDFNYEDFMIAVENDFNGFVSLTANAAVKAVSVKRDKNPDGSDSGKNPRLFVKADFSRKADTYRFGKAVDEGEVVFVFEIVDDTVLKLKEMSEPRPYGLIVP